LLQELGQCEGVHLFVDRAMLSRPTFVLTEQNTLAVAQVCDRLDGIPLAIELAAARVKIMSVEQILGFLKDRFQLLTAGSRTALPRQQTLRAAVDWSYELLAESERTLFNRLSVFAGGFSLEAVDAVCAAEGLESERLLDLLSALVDKSLVMAAEDGQGRSRYRLLEIFRQYGQERLAKDRDRATQLRHAEYFLKLAVAGEPELAGPQQATWLRRLEDEHDNVRTALRWSMDAGETDIVLELAGAIVRFWLMHGYLTEGRQWLTEALVLPSGSPAVRARALLGEGRIAWAQGDYAVARSSSQRSLDLVRELGDRAGIASALNSLGVIAHEQGDSVAARSFFEQSLAVSRELGDAAAIARALSNLGSWHFQRREFRAGTALHQEGLALYRMLNDRSSVAFALGNLGDAALEQGDLAAARTNFEENLAVRAQQGERVGVAFALERFAALACAESDEERAMRLAGAAASLRAALGSPLYPVERERLEHWLDPVRRALGARADVLMAEGNSMSMEQAIKYAQAVGAPHSGAAR
jgi:tetratricopeptide (TPR) repeat protein